MLNLRSLRFVPLLATLTACPPPCSQLCAKLERCDLSATVTLDECNESCDNQLDFFKNERTLSVEEKLFNQQRVCISSHSCDELAAGACFEDALFPALEP